MSNNMNKKFIIRTALLVGVLFALSGASSVALANDDGVGVSGTSTVATSTKKVSGVRGVAPNEKLLAKDAKAMESGKNKAGQEIDRRIAGLNKLLTSIGEMKRVSDADKTSINTNIQAQITSLTDLRAKIAADTDLMALKEDVKSITESYRIYALVIPKGHVLATSDAIATAINSLTDIGTKLQARISEAQAAGKDVTDLQSLVSDFTMKIADAKVQVQNTMSAVSPLVPDMGDKTKADANKAALQLAKTSLKTANQDLKGARLDANKIMTALKKLKISPKATSTPATTATSTQ